MTAREWTREWTTGKRTWRITLRLGRDAVEQAEAAKGQP